MFASIQCPNGSQCRANPCPFRHDYLNSLNLHTPSTLLGIPSSSIFSPHQLLPPQPQPSLYYQQLPILQPITTSIPTYHVGDLLPSLQGRTSSQQDGRSLLQALLTNIQTLQSPAPAYSPSPSLYNPHISQKRSYEVTSSSSPDVATSASVKKVKVAESAPSQGQLPASSLHGVLAKIQNSHGDAIINNNKIKQVATPQPSTKISTPVIAPSQPSTKVIEKPQVSAAVIAPLKPPIKVKEKPQVPSAVKALKPPTKVLTDGAEERRKLMRKIIAKRNELKITPSITKANIPSTGKLQLKNKATSPTALLAKSAISKEESLTATSPARTILKTTKEQSSPSKANQPVKAFQTQNQLIPLSKPQITLSIHSKVPHKTRQNVLNAIFTEFKRIYAPLLTEQPMLAHEQALTQEANVHNGATKKSYVGSGLSLISRLKQRPVAIDATDVALDGEWTPRPVVRAISAGEVSQYCIKKDSMKAMGYPMPPAIESPIELALDAAKQCERCGTTFTPREISTKEEKTACKFHWGNVFTEKANKGMAARRIYSCCNEAIGSVGCTFGTHVFKLADYITTNQYIPYKTLPPRNPQKPKQSIMALDAEMSYTTAGMELTRLATVNECNQVLIDEYIKPTYPILDLNTRFSGVEEHHIENAKFDLDSVHDWLFENADQETVLIGHGLENDLIAMRLLHYKVVDTADLFKHAKGLPYRHSLKHLTTKLLGRFIQQGIESHNPVEDAKSALDLVRLKVEKGKHYIFTY